MSYLSVVGQSDKAGANGAIGTSGQTKLDRFQNGNLFAMFATNIPIGGTGGVRFFYSTNNGSTWNLPPNPSPDKTPVNTSNNATFFIDEDDFGHLIMQDVLDGFKLKYYRGIPNGARTGMSWGTATDITGGLVAGNLGSPSMVVHREGTGWTAHVAIHQVVGSQQAVLWRRIQITSAGAITLNPSGGWDTVGALVTVTTPFTWPISIDFQHSGNGKSHAGVPSVFFSWLTHDHTGGGYGLRFRKATWTSANTYSLGTTRDIDTTLTTVSDTDYTAMGSWHCGFYDGTRYVMAGTADSGASGSFKFFIYERNVGDSATTTLYTSTFAGEDQLQMGAATYDADQNVRVWANGDFPTYADNTINSFIYKRSTSSITGLTTIYGDRNRWVHARKGWGAAGQVDYLMEPVQAPTPGAGVNVEFGAFDINVAPNAPTPTYPIGSAVIGRNISQDFTWNFSDPDGAGETESAHDIRYRVAGTTPWTTLTNQTATIGKHTFAALTFSNANYEWQVATYDQNGLVGPWSATQFFTGNTAPTTTAWTNPTNGGTIATSSITATWTDSGHTSYQFRLLDASSNILIDTGEVVSSGNSRVVNTNLAPNGVVRNFQVRVKNNGIWSPYMNATATVSYTPAANPTITAAYADVVGIGVPHAVNFTFSHPTPGGSQPTVLSQDLWVRDVGDTGDGVKVMAGGTPTGAVTWYAPKVRKAQEARLFMYGSNTTNTYSTWQAIPGTITLTGFLVHDPLAPLTTLVWCKYNDNGAKDSYSVESSLLQYAGRELPVVEFGDAVSRSIDVSKVYADSGESDALRALIARRAALCYRDSKSRKVFGVMDQHAEEDTVWGKMTSFGITQIEWEEAV